MKYEMNFFHESTLPLKLFVEFLSNQQNPTSNPETEWVELEKSYGPGVYSDILCLMTQIEFNQREARDHWFRIQEHRDMLQENLGRDPGLQVAVCDYFVNIGPKIKDVVLVEMHRLLQKDRFALVDELTGLYNRRFFNQMMAKEMENARRSGKSFSLLVLDIDFFKVFNDTHGHQAGDKLLVDLTQILSRTSRVGDHLTRYGGEEFAVILPRTDKRQAQYAGERYRWAVDQYQFDGQECLPKKNLTISVGVASFPDDGSTAGEVFHRADSALYEGKHLGRNRVICCTREKRLHPRYPAPLELLLRPDNSANNFMGPLKTENISMAGALCRHRHPLGIGSTLEMIIKNNRNKQVAIMGRVARMTKNPMDDSYYLGISFDLSSSSDEKALWTLIQNNVSTLQ